VYFFVRRFRPGFELDVALIAASSTGIVGYARAASTDMPLAASFTLGMLSWWSWCESGKKSYLAVFYGFMALGTLAKGPVAPFLAIAVIVLYAAAVRELRLVSKTLWLPGIVLFSVVVLPWYVAVEARNPEFFREFIVEHNLGRFSKNLYHHTEPFWYYLPVTALALLPWTVFAITAGVRSIGKWRASRKWVHDRREERGTQFAIFAGCWLVVPVAFFSLSQSKLAGYVLPAIPAGALLLADYLSEHLKDREDDRTPPWLVISHSLCAAAPIVPGLLIAYLITEHRLPGGQPMLVALALAFALCAGIALTLGRKNGLRMLRFVTLIPVVLTVGAVLKLGSVAIDQTLSTRPLAREIAEIETHPLPLAVYHVSRELEYGLTFYRNHLTFNYDWGSVPSEEHLLVAAENSQGEIAKLAAGRKVSYLGHYAPQRVDYYWVAAAAGNTPR
jgi:4-amino-4-deoxy-L-arabinose transferase-like glycosyltransferase